MSLLRIIFFAILIYLLLRIFRRWNPGGNNPVVSRKKNSREVPPPYDPSKVEDIPYQEVKKEEKKPPQQNPGEGGN